MAANPFTRCPCGSGRTTRHCCGASQARAELEEAQAYLAELVVPAICMVAACSKDELNDLYERALALPDAEPSLRVALPHPPTPWLTPLLRAVVTAGPGHVEGALPVALARLDTPAVRAGLARSVLAQRDAGRIEPRVAAVALLELSTPKLTRLLTASVVRAAADAAGGPMRAAG